LAILDVEPAFGLVPLVSAKHVALQAQYLQLNANSTLAQQRRVVWLNGQRFQYTW